MKEERWFAITTEGHLIVLLQIVPIESTEFYRRHNCFFTQ